MTVASNFSLRTLRRMIDSAKRWAFPTPKGDSPAEVVLTRLRMARDQKMVKRWERRKRSG